MRDLRLVVPAVAVWVAAAWLVGSSSGLAVGVALAAVAVAGPASTRWRVVGLAALLVALLSASCAWRLADVEASPLAVAAEKHTVVTVEAQVARDPTQYERFGVTSSVVELRVLRATFGGRTVAGRDSVVAFVKGSADDLEVGERLVARGRLGPADDTDTVASLSVMRRSAAEPAPSWWRAANRVRVGVRESMARSPEEPAALVPALVDGDDAAVSEQVQDDFRQSGLTHLLAVSGTNLTIVVGVVMMLLGRTRAGPRLRLALGLLAVAGFVLLARPDPSVVRAAAMGVVGLAALSLGSRGGIRVLAVAVIGLLVIDPWLSRTAGFVLSVCATAGILVLGPPFADRLSRWLPRWVAVAIAVPCAAQLACTPAIAALSGEVSLVAVAANLLAGPAVAPTTVLGLAAGLLHLVAPPLAELVGVVAGWGAAWVLAVGHHAAGLAGASVVWPGPWWTLLVATPAVAWALWRGLARPWVVAGLVVGLGLVMVRPPQPGWPADGWVMVACDVGQGDATVVRVDHDSAIVVDVGPEPAALARCLRDLRVRSVPLLVLTHAHADHVDGWAGLGNRRVGAVRVGPTGGPRLRPAAQRLVTGERFSVGDVDLEVLWPGADVATEEDTSNSEGSEVNDASVVLRVSTRGVRIMLTGDVEPDAQEAIVQSGADLTADVLKMPHHGSGRQSERFFRAVDPRLATISSGEANDYGHPAAAALELLQRLGISAWRTDLHGDVAVVERDGRLGVVTRK